MSFSTKFEDIESINRVKELVKCFTQRLNYAEGGILSSTLYFYQLILCWPEGGPQLNVAAAAAAAKSRQSCPTLCNPTDSSPPGSPVPGILQARTLEWVAISFSDA